MLREDMAAVMVGVDPGLFHQTELLFLPFPWGVWRCNLRIAVNKGCLKGGPSPRGEARP